MEHGAHGWGDWAPLAVVAAAAALYLTGARRQARWSGRRTAAFLAGVAALAVAGLPDVVLWAHADLRGHMVQHVLVGMLAPLGLVLGAPTTLLLRTLSVPSARRVARVLKSAPVAALTHPVPATVLNLGGMVALYATPLYAAMQASPALHAAVHAHTLAAGVLFTWAILAGPDPAPHPASMWVRTAVLLLSVAGHAVLGKLMYGYLLPRGTPDAAGAVQAAAQIMYYGGDLAEALLAGVLFWSWLRARRPRYMHEPAFRSTTPTIVASVAVISCAGRNGSAASDEVT